MKFIVLDGGHGLKTAGKQTLTGIKEWTLNDSVCDKITAILENYDCFVYRTDHDEGTIDEPLTARVREYISKNADCVVSVHHNAFTNTWNNATGFEVYTDRNATAADNRLAQLIYNGMLNSYKLRPRGIKKANFTIINQNKIPAVLVEGGFMDSKIDYKYIISPEGQEDYARGVASGLIEFLNLQKKNDKTLVITYQAHEKSSRRWLPVVDTLDVAFAGNIGEEIDAVRFRSNIGNIYYRAHEKSSRRWLPEVKNFNDFAGNIGKDIDAVMIRTDNKNFELIYSVHEKSSRRWLPDVSGYNVNDNKNGYAGNIGKAIDAVKIQVIYKKG